MVAKSDAPGSDETHYGAAGATAESSGGSERSPYQDDSFTERSDFSRAGERSEATGFDRVGGSTSQDIERLREEIGETLRALEDKLNVGKRVDEAVDRTCERVSDLRDNNPVAFVIGIAGVAVLAGAAVWAIARKIL
ncbi:DUF3618 domain-containing protein [Lysinibacter sp. HNR]|uniref:DUF3618 domain-containing protein n=1 Tax=Lysinibacter sp. HNR TaxID=3031408 RepID=UPI002435C99C|nr:DUF3618 domain-containing protein [Lysinibacter sp. HNR]WGD37651.1 DUF3618 domain-containing protein [Lysinibacter sp. HNR]